MHSMLMMDQFRSSEESKEDYFRIEERGTSIAFSAHWCEQEKPGAKII